MVLIKSLIFKFMCLGSGVFFLSACAINAEKVTVTGDQVLISPSQDTSNQEAQVTELSSEDQSDASYAIKIHELNTQQRLELYKGLQSLKPDDVSDVVQDADTFRVRFQKPLTRNKLSQYIRNLAKLGSASYDIRFLRNDVFIEKIN